VALELANFIGVQAGLGKHFGAPLIEGLRRVELLLGFHNCQNTGL
jgi:hypothetical protein